MFASDFSWSCNQPHVILYGFLHKKDSSMKANSKFYMYWSAKFCKIHINLKALRRIAHEGHSEWISAQLCGLNVSIIKPSDTKLLLLKFISTSGQVHECSGDHVVPKMEWGKWHYEHTLLRHLPSPIAWHVLRIKTKIYVINMLTGLRNAIKFYLPCMTAEFLKKVNCHYRMKIYQSLMFISFIPFFLCA